MKKVCLIFTALIFVCNINVLSQKQLHNWYIGPNEVDVPASGTPSVSLIPTFLSVPPHQAIYRANGMYDKSTPNPKLVFYVIDDSIFDYNNTFMGKIILPTQAATEIAIVPFGTNHPLGNDNPCQDKYNVFSTAGGFSTGVVLIQTIVDMKNFSVTSSIIDQMPYSAEFGTIAVGNAYPGNHDQRHLYFMAASGNCNLGTGEGEIHKLEVRDDGQVSGPTLLYPQNPSTFTNAACRVFSRELDLSPDGRWLAWASFSARNTSGFPPQERYHLIHLDQTTGNLDLSVVSQVDQEFDTGTPDNDAHDGFRGVEFWQSGGSTKLFVGAGEQGVYSFDVPSLLNQTQVQGSFPTYGNSQIELAYNGLMYASSEYISSTTNNVGAWDPSAAPPAILTNSSFVLGNPGLTITDAPHTPWQGNTTLPINFYTLPDQIDGQDYSTIVPAFVPPILTANWTIDGAIVSNNFWSYGSSTTSNNPWGTSSPVVIDYELRLKNNANLTIHGMTFKFGHNAKVIIEEGSSLTLDHSVFTSSTIDDQPTCHYIDSWVGIEVWGGNNLSQLVANKQGKLTLISSTIENAQWGARLWRPMKPTPTSYTSSGGIINVSGYVNDYSYFKNNNVDVEFKPYQNFKLLSNGSTQNLGNLSRFKDCFFESNDNYPFATAPVHVSIEGCNGIAFKNCTFQSPFGNSGVSLLPAIGIKAVDGGFTVDWNSNFSNLWHGIDAIKIKKNRPFKVVNSRFTNNQTGILSKSISVVVAQSNEFNFGANQNWPIHTGITSEKCSGYVIEENIFASSGTATKYGIMINNSGPAANQIYKNSFNGLDYGNLAFAINRDNQAETFKGLQYLCNKNELNLKDFFIGKQNSMSFPYGIRTNQGTTSLPAGNKFSHMGPSGTPTDINNLATNINYFYWNGSSASVEEPFYFNAPKVGISSLNSPNICPTHISCPSCRLTYEQLQELRSLYDSSESAYINLLYIYNQLMDGGNTNSLLNYVQQNWSSAAWLLRDNLIAQSPYLTQQVIMQVAYENVLPSAMLLEVCIANPDATRDQSFLDYLQFEIPNPLPQYMINAIIASWDVRTARTTMECSLGDYNSNMATSSDRILNDLYFKTDLENGISVLSEFDSTDYNLIIRYWLQRVQSLTAKYDLIENYIGTNDLDSAQSILDSIPSNFNLSDDQQAAYDSYVYFFNFRNNLISNEQDISELQEAQLQTLINYSISNDYFANQLARNVLCYYYDICTEENYNILTEGGRTFNQTFFTSTPENISVLVAPNPALNYAKFNYSLPNLNGKIELIIYDISGKEIYQSTLIDTIGEKIWDTSKINNGIYHYFIMNGNLRIANGNIAVTK